MLKEGQFLVSNDSSGVMGWPRHWEQAWGFLNSDAAFGGYEMIAWGGMFKQYTEAMLKSAKELQLNVVGLHGQTGGIHDTYNLFHRVVLGSLNKIVLPIDKLVELHNGYDYMLLHAPMLRSIEAIATLVENRDRIKTVYVENHLRPGGVGTAVDVARDLRGLGVKAGVMVDLFHDIDSRLRIDRPEIAFDKSLWMLENAAEQKDFDGKLIPVSAHIPVGTKSDDSLPMDCITPKMWGRLGKTIRSIQGVHVVIENQQSGLGSVIPLKLEQQRERNKIVVDVLRNADVI